MGADVVRAPRLSVATAVREWVPAGGDGHVSAQLLPHAGTLAPCPTSVAPSKKSTDTTLPFVSPSPARASATTVDGSVNTLAGGGAAISTVGGAFPPTF